MDEVLTEENLAPFAIGGRDIWAFRMHSSDYSDDIKICVIHGGTPYLGEIVDHAHECIHSTDINWFRSGNTFVLHHSRPDARFDLKVVFLSASFADDFVTNFTKSLVSQEEGQLIRDERNKLHPEWLRSGLVYPQPIKCI